MQSCHSMSLSGGEGGYSLMQWDRTPTPHCKQTDWSHYFPAIFVCGQQLGKCRIIERFSFVFTDNTELLDKLAHWSEVMKMSSFKEPRSSYYTGSVDYLNINHHCSPKKVISCPLCSHCDKRNLCIALSCCNLFHPVLFGNDCLRLIALDNSFTYHCNLGNMFLWSIQATKADTKNRLKNFNRNILFL